MTSETTSSIASKGNISQNGEDVKHAVSDKAKKSDTSRYEAMSEDELISLYSELLRADKAREAELSEIDKELSELSAPTVKEQREKQKTEAVKRGKRRAANLLRTLGFQMPNPLRQSGFVGSISYFNDSVNIEGKNFSDVFEEIDENDMRYAVSDEAKKSGVAYAYLKTETTVDGMPVTVVMDIRKSPQKNKLWVHRVYTKANVETGPTGASSKIGLNAGLNVEDNISQKGEFVKSG